MIVGTPNWVLLGLLDKDPPLKEPILIFTINLIDEYDDFIGTMDEGSIGR